MYIHKDDINELMKDQLTQKLYNDVLNIVEHSREFDERLSDPMVTSSISDQLVLFADGLIEYTEARLRGLPPEDSAVPVPFNLLSAKILYANIFQVWTRNVFALWTALILSLRHSVWSFMLGSGREVY